MKLCWIGSSAISSSSHPQVDFLSKISNDRGATELSQAPVGRLFQLVVLIIAATAAAYARFAISPLQEAMRSSLALSDNEMGLLQGPAMALFPAIAAIPLGLIVDRYSRARFLAILAALSVLGGALSALASGFAILFSARCLVGITTTAAATTVFSLLGDLFPPAERGRASMLIVIGQFGGTAAAFAFGGALLSAEGPGPDAWRWALLILTAPLIAVIFVVLALREPARTQVTMKNPSVRGTLKELWRHRTVLAPILVGAVMAEAAIGATLVWSAPALSRSFALSPDRIGTIMSVAVLASGVLGSLAGGPIADICHRTGGPRRTMSILSGLAALSAPAGLFAVLGSVAPASGLLCVFMLIIDAILVASIALFTVVIPNELRGFGLAGLLAADTVIGIGVAPMLVSLLSGAMGGSTMMGKSLALTCTAASVLSALAFAFGSRHFPRAETD
jgi:predicted MFS family arabinose efflux permease